MSTLVGRDQTNVRIGNEVRAWLGRRNISASKAAKRLRWSQSYISRRLMGYSSFTAKDLVDLADLLEIEPAAFFSEPADIRRRSVTLVPLAA